MCSCTTQDASFAMKLRPRCAATSAIYTNENPLPFMKFQRIFAIIERDMRKFFRSPALMMSSMIFPLMQLIVLGYAFGGKIKGIKIAVVDDDHTVYSRDLRERFDAIVAGPQTLQVENYNSVSDATVDLRAGFVR